MQLAALALPPHPAAFAGREDAAAMEKEEAVAARRRAVDAVQPRYAVGGKRQKAGVTRGRLLVGVEPIEQQRKMQLAADAREIVDLQPLDVFAETRFVGHQRRHDDHRPQMLRHAVGKFESGKQPARRRCRRRRG